jgi:YegS/Rv2252/BmrU family lipid kinase
MEIRIGDRKLLLLYNASAGTGVARRNLYQLITQLAEKGCETVAYPILPKRGLTTERIVEMLKERGQHFDYIACCGGDGTLNHLVNALMQAGWNEIPVLYVPTGTTNDFARSLHIPGDPARSAALLDHGQAFCYDIGQFENRYFNYVAAFGAFTAVSYETDQNMKNAIGYAAYILTGVLSASDSLMSRIHMRIEHDGIIEEDAYLFGAVSNTTSVAGIKSPALSKAEMDDGLFEVILIKAPDDLNDVREILQSLAQGNTEGGYFRVFRTDEVRFAADQEVSWTLDGENGGEIESAVVRVVPKAVRILVPDRRLS